MTRTATVRSAISRSHSFGSALSRTSRFLAKAALIVTALGAFGMMAPSADAQVYIEHNQEIRLRPVHPVRPVRLNYAGTFIVDNSSYRISTLGCSIDQIANALICEGYDVRFVNGWLRVYKDWGGPEMSWYDGAYGLIVRSHRNYFSLALTQRDNGDDYGRDHRDDRGHGRRVGGGGFYGRFDAGDGSIEIGIGVDASSSASTLSSSSSSSTFSSSSDNRLESSKAFRSGASEVSATASLTDDVDDVNDHGTVGFKSTREQSGGRTSVGQPTPDKNRVPDIKGEVGHGKSLPIIDNNKRNDAPKKVTGNETGGGPSRDTGGKKDTGSVTKAPVQTPPGKVIVKEADTVKNRNGGSDKGVVAKPLPVQQPIVTLPTIQPAKQPVKASGKMQNGVGDRSGLKNDNAK